MRRSSTLFCRFCFDKLSMNSSNAGKVISQLLDVPIIGAGQWTVFSNILRNVAVEVNSSYLPQEIQHFRLPEENVMLQKKQYYFILFSFSNIFESTEHLLWPRHCLIAALHWNS